MHSYIPPRLQSILWSCSINNLRLDADKTYIIHQVLAYGDLKDLKWLFTVYPQSTIEQIFTSVPYKDYRRSRYYFVKDFILGTRQPTLSESAYVKNIPRNT